MNEQQFSLEDEMGRRRSNADRVHQALMTAGRAGVTNDELARIAGHRFGGRIYDLRLRGIAIVREQTGRGLWRYWLADKAPAGVGLRKE
jgi:hypothetical protein